MFVSEAHRGGFGEKWKCFLNTAGGFHRTGASPRASERLWGQPEQGSGCIWKPLLDHRAPWSRASPAQSATSHPWLVCGQERQRRGVSVLSSSAHGVLPPPRPVMSGTGAPLRPSSLTEVCRCRPAGGRSTASPLREWGLANAGREGGSWRLRGLFL